MVALFCVNTYCILSQAADIASGDTLSVEDVDNILHDSNISNKDKTNYLLQYLSNQRDSVLDFAKTLCIAIIVFVIGRRLVELFLRLNEKWMDKREVEIGAKRFILSFLRVVYYILLIFLVAGILGVGTSSIVAMVGSAGLAIGLALQGSLSNVAGGVLILLTHPFQVGDYISVDGVEGTVASIDVFYTKIATVENKIIVIPNGTVSNSKLINNTKADYRMLILDFSVKNGTDIKKLRGELLGIMKNKDVICQDKDMSIVVDKLGPVYIKMQAKCWTATEKYSAVRYEMLEEIQDCIDKYVRDSDVNT